LNHRGQKILIFKSSCSSIVGYETEDGGVLEDVKLEIFLIVTLLLQSIVIVLFIAVIIFAVARGEVTDSQQSEEFFVLVVLRAIWH